MRFTSCVSSCGSEPARSKRTGELVVALSAASTPNPNPVLPSFVASHAAPARANARSVVAAPWVLGMNPRTTRGETVAHPKLSSSDLAQGQHAGHTPLPTLAAAGCRTAENNRKGGRARVRLVCSARVCPLSAAAGIGRRAGRAGRNGIRISPSPSSSCPSGTWSGRTCASCP